MPSVRMLSIATKLELKQPHHRATVLAIILGVLAIILDQVQRQFYPRKAHTDSCAAAGVRHCVEVGQSRSSLLHHEVGTCIICSL